MRRGWIILVVGLQLLVLIGMAVDREWIVRTGRTVYLRTAPVDPRDPFRGDYVTLDYEVSHVPTNRLRDGLVRIPDRPGTPPVRNGQRVYTVLRQDGELAGLDYVTDQRPDADLFLRGRLDPRWGGLNHRVRYGIEAFFVEQGKGMDLERRRARDEVQIPLEMRVAVGRGGVAVLKGYRWSLLGVGLRTETVPTNRADTPRPVQLVKAAMLILMNTSDRDVAIVDMPDGGSLTLEPDSFQNWGNNPWTWVQADRARTRRPDVKDIHILKPGDQHGIRVDLAHPDWFVVKPGEPPRTLSGLADWGTRFRLVYRPPDAMLCEGLPDADLIWHGYLPSRVFDGGGRVD